MSTDAKYEEPVLSNREKMLHGLPYCPADPELVAGRYRAMKYIKAYNDSIPNSDSSADERIEILADLFRVPLEKARQVIITPPFFCDYGTNIEFNGIVFMNFNVTILDSAKVTIGDRVAFGPGVQIYGATHSVIVAERRSMSTLGRAYPVTIGDDVWIGGNAILLGPCKIGNGVTVAAGSVVKGDIPDNVVVGGNPARILKHLDPPPPMEQTGFADIPGVPVS